MKQCEPIKLKINNNCCDVIDTSIQKKLMEMMMIKHDDMLKEFMTPYIRELGVKGDLTKSKLKWHGIKLSINSFLGYIEYQLLQRGKIVSPKFKIEFNNDLS